MERKIVEYLLGKKPQRWIMQALGVGDRRVRRVQLMAESHGYLDGSHPIPPFPEALFPDPADGRALRAPLSDRVLSEKKEWITDRLQTGWRPITVVEVCLNEDSLFLHIKGWAVAQRVAPKDRRWCCAGFANLCWIGLASLLTLASD